MSSTRTMTSHKPRHPQAFRSVSAFGLDSGDEDTRLRLSLNPTRNSGLGTKRGFFDANDGCCGNGGGVSGALTSQGCAAEVAIAKDIVAAVFDRDEGSSEWEKAKNDRGSQHGSAAAAPAAKTQFVGWPPIRTFRENTTASDLAKNNEDVEGKLGATGCVYVKVSMDGAPYLRKVDLKNFKTYAELLTALEQMFSCFAIASGSRASKELPGGEISSQKQLSDPVSSSEYVLTYEDKDGDWMLVGDVPWRMFAESCRRMRIVKGPEATGLGTEVSHRGHFYFLPSREFMTYSVLAELPDCTGEKSRNRD